MSVLREGVAVTTSSLDALSNLHRRIMHGWVRGQVSELDYERAKCWIRSAEHALINLRCDLEMAAKDAFESLSDDERAQAFEVEHRA